MSPAGVAGAVVGFTIAATALIGAMTFGLIAMFGMLGGGIISGAVVVLGMFCLIWWAESR